MVTIPTESALTQAEAKVLALVEVGYSNQMIAAKLMITIGTVKSHLHRIFEKLDARNRLEAIERARLRRCSAISMETLGG